MMAHNDEPDNNNGYNLLSAKRANVMFLLIVPFPALDFMLVL
jgi:hypothetical protein